MAGSILDLIQYGQNEANRYLREAKKQIREGTADVYTERAYYNAQNRIRIFQKKYGQHRGYLISTKGLTDIEDDEKSMKALENLAQLEQSITENVRLNPEKAKSHRESQVQFYMDQGWASNRKAAEAIYDFKGSEAFESLMEKNLGDIPSQIVERYGKFVDADFSVEQFSNMIAVFNKQGGNYDEFIDFADKYIEQIKWRSDDIDKAAQEYMDSDLYDEYGIDFFEFLSTF